MSNLSSALSTGGALTNGNCTFVPDPQPVVTTLLAGVTAALGTLFCLGNVLLLVSLLPPHVTWLSRWADGNLGVAGLLLSLMTATSAAQILMGREPALLRPSVCRSVTAFQLFAVTEYFAMSLWLTLLSLVTVSNPLRLHTAGYRVASVVLLSSAWVIGATCLTATMLVAVNDTEYSIKQLCKYQFCSFHIYSKTFMMITIHGVIGLIMLVSGALDFALYRIARRHALQIDAQQNSVSQNHAVAAPRRSRASVMDRRALQTLPYAVAYNVAPAALLLNTHCPLCLPPAWNTFVLCVPLGLAATMFSIKKINPRNLEYLKNKAQLRFSR